MSWFSFEPESTDELQARLQGLYAVVVAQGYIGTAHAKEYQQIITELARRGVKPAVTLVPKATQ